MSTLRQQCPLAPVLFALSLLLPTVAGAAPILLHQPGTAVGTFSMGTNEVRQTHLEVLNPITVTALGAEIDPGANSVFGWRIYESNATNAIISTVFTQTGITFTDIGMAVYDTAVSVNLMPGFYLVELHNSVNSSGMMRYDESDQALPFLTSDSNFRVINGCGSGGGPGAVACNNTILPAFSLSTEAAVPVPASLLLLFTGLAGIGYQRRKPAKVA